jgi:ribosomal protein L30E
MDINKNKEYYKTLKKEDICNCDYCKNYISQVKKQYPITSDFLKELGVDIEKPFEVIPLEAKDDIIYYSEILYVVLGDKSEFKKAKIGKVKVELADSYPDTNIKENHYVIKLSPIAIQNMQSIMARSVPGMG